MKKLLTILLTLSITFSAACKNNDVLPDQNNYPRLNDVTVQKQNIIKIDVSGDVSGIYKMKIGYWVFSRSNNDEKSFVTLTDLSCNEIWSYAIESRSNGVVYISDDVIVVDSFKDGNIALNKNGKELWKTKFEDKFKADVFVSDNAEGLFVFGRDNNTNDHKCTYYHISVSGLVSNPQEYKNIPNCIPIKGFNDNDGFWMYGYSDNIGFLAHIKYDLTIDKICYLRKDHYPQILFEKELNRIILYGQCYQSGIEKGFIQEFNSNLDENFYKKFDFVPWDIIRLKDNMRVVSFHDRANAMKDKIGIFDSNWNEKEKIEIQYRNTKLHTIDNGGFIITGSRLSPGQGYSAMFINSIQPHMDTIVEEYDNSRKLISRKTFFSENSRSGYGFFTLISNNGNIIISD